MRFASRLLLLLPLGLMMSCDRSDTAGNTTEIENAIAIRVFDGDSPAHGVAYRVLPSWFVADTNETAIDSEYVYTGETDEDGWMHIDGHPEGSFTVQFSKNKYSIVATYTLDNLTPHVTIDSVTLAKPGTIKGRVDLPANPSVCHPTRQSRRRPSCRSPSYSSSARYTGSLHRCRDLSDPM